MEGRKGHQFRNTMTAFFLGSLIGLLLASSMAKCALKAAIPSLSAVFYGEAVVGKYNVSLNPAIRLVGMDLEFFNVRGFTMKDLVRRHRARNIAERQRQLALEEEKLRIQAASEEVRAKLNQTVAEDMEVPLVKQVTMEDMEKARNTSLEELCRAAARGDTEPERNAVIVSMVAGAWAGEGGLLDVFIARMRSDEGLQRLLSHLILLCMDEAAFIRCLQIHALCFAAMKGPVDKTVSPVSSVSRSMDIGYGRLMWDGVELVRTILKAGYHVLYTDIDVVWFRNPFPLLQGLFPFSNWLVSIDRAKDVQLRNFTADFNAGYYYARHRNATLAVFDLWVAGRKRWSSHQYALNRLKLELMWGRHANVVRWLDMRFEMLPTQFFGGLCEMACDAAGLQRMYMVHMNCCFLDDNKVERMKAFVHDRRLMANIGRHRATNDHTISWHPTAYYCLDFGCVANSWQPP